MDNGMDRGRRAAERPEPAVRSGKGVEKPIVIGGYKHAFFILGILVLGLLMALALRMLLF